MSENQTNLAPHAAIIQIIYEVYEQDPHGHYKPNKKSDGKKLLVLKGSDYAVCMNRLNNFLDQIRKDYDNVTIESEGQGPGEPPVAGSGGAFAQRPQVFGMRSGFARHTGD